MSHITIIISRTPHPTDTAIVSNSSECSATVTYEVPHAATDADVAQAVKKLVKQVRELGS